ncbi:MAG TPA: hypothetical protein VIL97_00285 [Thermoanaerobaculia bacterium]
MIWREKRLLLSILGGLLVVNLFFFLTYRVQYQERVEALEKRYEESTAKLDDAKRDRIAAERQLTAHRSVIRNTETLYNDQWSTADRRLIPLLLEIRRLADKSQVGMPRSIQYEQAVQERESGALGTTSMGISFTIRGTYQEIRRLINLIELSQQFMIIDEIGISDSSSGEGRIQLSIRLKTLFHEPGAPVRQM